MTLIKRIGIEALYRKPITTTPSDGHHIHPYLLRGLKIDCPNQVRAMDIMYIPMARGFVYPAALVDWATRRVLSWRVSITMTKDFCLEALDEALSLYGRPQNQGSQFASHAFTEALRSQEIAGSQRQLARQHVCRTFVAKREV